MVHIGESSSGRVGIASIEEDGVRREGSGSEEPLRTRGASDAMKDMNTKTMCSSVAEFHFFFRVGRDPVTPKASVSEGGLSNPYLGFG